MSSGVLGQAYIAGETQIAARRRANYVLLALLSWGNSNSWWVFVARVVAHSFARLGLQFVSGGNCFALIWC